VAVPAPAAERFKKMARLSFAYVREHDDLRALIAADSFIYSLDPAQDRFAAVNRSARDLLAGLVAEGQKSGEFRADLDLGSAVDFLYDVYIAFLIKAYSLAEGEEAAPRFEAGIDIVINGIVSR
jgi:hypothetical protein